MSQRFSQYLFLLINALILLTSQLLLKQGVKKSGAISLTNWMQFLEVIGKVLTTPLLLIGVCLGGVSTLLWIVVLSRFELSQAALLMTGTYYVLILLASALILGESVTAWRWLGAILMIIGMAFVFNSSPDAWIKK